MRLYNYVKIYGNYTKSEIRQLNLNNSILVNNEKKSLLYPLKDNDIVTINNKIIYEKKLVYYLYYKPKGILSTINNDPSSYIHHINIKEKVMPAGRLDKDSEGLLLLTNDGKYINLICNPKTHFEKEYIVTLENKVTNDFLKNVGNSIILDNRTTKEIIVSYIDEYNIKMILTEGIYHQIRRTVKLYNNKVSNLKRIRIGNYCLNDMKEGDIIKISPSINQ